MEKGLKNEGLDVESLSSPGDRYALGEIIGHGVSAKVYAANDSQSEGKKVAIKEQKLTAESLADIEEEYKILRDLSDHPNLPDFYGVYLKKDGENQYVWFVMQLCEAGPVTDLVRALHRQAKKMSELHIGFILRETLKALIFLHENHVIHRDVKGSNILLTKDGEVKLVDFGVSRELSSTLGKRQTSIGSPCWMAPEVVANDTSENSFYDNRADVWALGITAIELGDGKAPFEGMHPTRTLFQIVRNPPPTLYRPANWSQNYNDFISECLVKNPEYRPYMSELLEHPFLQELPENDFHLNAELKSILENVKSEDKELRQPEIKIKAGLLKKNLNDDPEPMLVQDLAAMEVITEDTVIELLESRFLKKQYYTFVGDVLVFLNPGTMSEAYNLKHCSKYKFKSRSDNDPHIYSVADTAYQDMMHHDVPQNIILSGETMSGKSTQYKHLVRQLIYLGQGVGALGDKLQRSIDLIHSFGNASTPENGDSTRHALLTQVTFSGSGRLSGVIFWLFQLEKWRVTGNRCPHHTNYHIFYYFYDGLKAKGELEKYNLNPERQYCYLRRNIDDSDKDPKVPPGPREDPEGNVEWFERINKTLKELEFTESDTEFVWKVLAAILLLGDVEYKEDDDGNADIKDIEIVEKIATLLEVDSKRLAWGLCNYCVVENDTAARRKHSRPEAMQARNVLAQTMYGRLVDWLVNNINVKMSFTRAVFGDHHVVNILDMFGFECYLSNGIEQLFVNSLNEQLHYFFNQKIFISETQDEEEDEIEPVQLSFYNNRETMDEILNKPNGLMHILDEANKMNLEGDFVLGKLQKRSESNHVKREDDEHLSVAHYTGKVTYEADTLCSKNRDFLPPELTEVLRQSENAELKSLFTNKLSRSGNVTMTMEKAAPTKAKGKKKWGAALLADSSKLRRCNTTSKGEFSQTKGIRTASTTFRATSLEILKMLANGSSLFVRCIRTRLNNSSTPSAETQFHKSIIRQQVRALGITDTSKARKNGFSHRIPFEKFLESYQFLAFDFEENVEKTKDNCRLLLIRLKMEGWALGKSKVFLKYYNEEFLSRLYETQVKKIVKVQSMLRQFLARRNVAKKKELSRESSLTAIQIRRQTGDFMSEHEAATTIQRHMKGYCVRRKYGPLVDNSNKLDNATASFIREYFKKWRAKSIFQVLVLYRASKHQELVYFSQQVHLYNQNSVSELTSNDPTVSLDSVREDVGREEFLGVTRKITACKMPFKLRDLPFCDTTSMCGSVYERVKTPDEPRWDEPFLSLNKFCQTQDFDDLEATQAGSSRHEKYAKLVNTRYTRDLEAVDELYDTRSFNNFELESPARRRQPSICEVNSPAKAKTPRQSPANTHRSPIRSIPDPPIFVTPSENGIIDFRKNLKPVRPASKTDPILEMEMRGARCDSQNEDDPPYNFQAMLRKTNHQKYSVVKAPKLIMNENDDFDAANNNPSMDSSNRKGYDEKETRTEILPGFFVIGHITDL